MESNILAMYLGCRVRATFETDEYAQGTIETVGTECVTFTHQIPDYYYHEPEFKLQLILRPLSSMTKEDFIDCKVMSEKLVRGFGDQQKLKFKVDGFGGFTIYKTDAYVTQWLLSKGFDLFDLIEKGEAIDSTKL